MFPRREGSPSCWDYFFCPYQTHFPRTPQIFVLDLPVIFDKTTIIFDFVPYETPIKFDILPIIFDTSQHHTYNF